MPAYDIKRGQKVRATIEGYVTYNTGGFVGISLRPPVDDEDPPKGEYLDVCEAFVVGEPEVLPPVPSGTLYLETATGWVWQTEGMKIVRISGPVDSEPVPCDLHYVLSIQGEPFVRLIREDSDEI